MLEWGVAPAVAAAVAAELGVELAGLDGTDVDDEHHLVAAGDADRHGDYSPMTELVLVDGRVERREIWPTEEHHGLAVLLSGGEVGVLTAWRHDDDKSWWQWSVEFSNHTGRPADWAPPQGKLRP